METLGGLLLTMSARHGIKALGMTLADALQVIQMLSPQQFYKAMTVHADHRVWQDVYHGKWQNRSLYIKFQQHVDYFVVSFKER